MVPFVSCCHFFKSDEIIFRKSFLAPVSCKVCFLFTTFSVSSFYIEVLDAFGVGFCTGDR